MTFLGGRYLHTEQVIAGSVQTFRAREAETNRSVFVHRVDDPSSPQQADLLRLLLTCLFRSAAVKQRVLDVIEQSGVVYVVTESVPECLLLREWLHFESDRSDLGGHSHRVPPRADASAPYATVTNQSAVSRLPESPEQIQAKRNIETGSSQPALSANSPPVGEFTRLFQQSDVGHPQQWRTNEPKLGEVQASGTGDVPHSGDAALEPKYTGEFSRLFYGKQGQPSPQPQAAVLRPIRAVAPVFEESRSPLAAHGDLSNEVPLESGGKRIGPREPGEFTRFFQSPTAEPNHLDEGSEAANRHTDESVSKVESTPSFPTSFVDSSPRRTGKEFPPDTFPATAQSELSDSPASKKGLSPGEFTRLFGGANRDVPLSQKDDAKPDASSGRVQRSFDLPPYLTIDSNSSGEFPNTFSSSSPAAPSSPKIPIGVPPAPGEFTKLFSGDEGKTGREPPTSAENRGEYTARFGSGEPASPPAQPPGGSQNVPTGSPGQPPPMPPKATPGPSEFTRVVMGSGPSSSAVPPTPAAGAPPPVPPRVGLPSIPPPPSAPPGDLPAAPELKKSRAFVWLALLLAFVVAAMLILFAIVRS
jgi:hypothetical protein